MLKAHLHTHRGAQRDNNVEGAQRIPCSRSRSHQPIKSLSDQLEEPRGYKDRWEPELRISEGGTLCLLRFSQGCPRGVSALVARHETHPDESIPEHLGTGRSCCLGRGTQVGWGLSGLPGPRESQPAVPVCVTVCTTTLAVGLWP